MQNAVLAHVINGTYNSIDELNVNTKRAMSLITDDYPFYTPFGALVALNERGVSMRIKLACISTVTTFGQNSDSILELIDLYRRRRIVNRNIHATSAYIKKWAQEMLAQTNSI